MTAAIKSHARIEHERSLCGHGKGDSVKPLSEFFAVPEAEQCDSCLKKVAARGYSVAALRKRYQRLTAEPVQTPALSATKTAAATSQPDPCAAVKRTAVEQFDKTIAQIEANQTEIARFERLCGQLRERGFEFAHKVTPHPYAISYSLKLDRAQTPQLGELLAELVRLGYADHDPAFPNITGMRALEITGPGAPAFTLNYVRQIHPSIAALTHRLALNQLEEAHHAHRFDQ
jgi:hypothetical protein